MVVAAAVWLERKRAGTLKRPSFAEIFAPALLRTTLVATILSACAYAAAFGTLQVTVSHGVPGLPDLAEAREQLTSHEKANKDIQKELSALPKDSPVALISDDWGDSGASRVLNAEQPFVLRSTASRSTNNEGST